MNALLTTGAPVTTYPPDQVISIAIPQARILTQRGIDDCPPVGFRAARQLRPVDRDPACVQIGAFGPPEAPVGLGIDGRVVCFSPWSDAGCRVVNTSLSAFVDSLDAFTRFGPFSADPDIAEVTARHLRPILAHLDPAALADADGVWPTLLDKVAAGR